MRDGCTYIFLPILFVYIKAMEGVHISETWPYLAIFDATFCYLIIQHTSSIDCLFFFVSFRYGDVSILPTYLFRVRISM